MNIVGLSGVHGAMPFKRAEWPGREEREYRMVQGQDAAACLLVDGEIVAAAAEERFDGIKHSGNVPASALRYCLDEASLSLSDIDAFVHAFDYSPYERLFQMTAVSKRRFDQVYSREALLRPLAVAFPDADISSRFQCVEHHVAHAASAYLVSGFDDCLVFVADGMGEVHSMSGWHGRNGQLVNIGRTTANNSIGTLYSLITLHLGFEFNSDEYKIMGLAPYGDPGRFGSFFDEVVRFSDDGKIEIPILGLNRTGDEAEFYSATRAYLARELLPPRQPDEELTSEHRDVAAALQVCLNRCIQHLCAGLQQETGLRRLAMAGGVALNCTANGELRSASLFEDIYVQAAAGDDGAALGAALHWASTEGELKMERMAIPYFGPAYGPDQLQATLDAYADRIAVVRYPSMAATCQAAAKAIADGAVVAWYRGRMEFGPRALGNRSILADPGDPRMRDRVNSMVKMREAFRPFAPAVTLEQAPRWFEIDEGEEHPYMITIVNVRPEHRASLPAVTHVDGTARVQTVSRADNEAFYSLLKEVGKLSGREMVLNTSFNVKGQPMVNTPEEAVETFLGTGIDLLFLEDRVLSRR